MRLWKKGWRGLIAVLSVAAMLAMTLAVTGTVAVMAEGEEEIKAEVDFSLLGDEFLGKETVSSGGLTFTFGTHAWWNTGVRDLQLNADGPKSRVGVNVDFLNIRISDPVLKAALGPKVTLEVEYWDKAMPDLSKEQDLPLKEGVTVSSIPRPGVPANEEAFQVQYNTPDSQYSGAGEVKMINSGMFETVRFYTKNAAFGDYDHNLRIGCRDTGSLVSWNGQQVWPNFPLYIKRITVKKTIPRDTLAPYKYTDADGADHTTFPAMTDLNSFRGKSVTGYQMWFTATNSDSGWVHWNGGSRPGPENLTVEMFPDISEYPDSVLEATGFMRMGNGQASRLFSSWRQETVDLHVKWMKDYGIDGFAIQRFYPSASMDFQRGVSNLDMALKAAEENDRLFYVMYDLNYARSDGTEADEALRSDWISNIEERGLINSPCYAQMDGRPVVSLWGLDENSTSYMTHDAVLGLITWFQNRGYYVIGGIPNNDWAKDDNGDGEITAADDPFWDVYRKLDMASPWTVGRYNGLASVASWVNGRVKKEHMVFCEKYGVDYQPVVLAGSAWSNFNWGPPNDMSRMQGQFMWRQAQLLKDAGSDCVYFAMFDEYDEGTAIMKASQDSFDTPEEQYFLTMSADGTWISSDFYLRLAGEIARRMRGTEPLPAEVPIPWSEGPLYYRNGFESVMVNVKQRLVTEDGREYGAQYDPPRYQEGLIDPCAVMNAEWEVDTSEWVDPSKSPHAGRVENRETALGGNWQYEVNGWTKQAGKRASFYTWFGEMNTVIPASGLELSYGLLPLTEMGRYVYIDLVLEREDGDGEELLSDIMGGVRGARGTVYDGDIADYTEVKVRIGSSLAGRRIIGIMASYDQSNAPLGEFHAYIDNIILQAAEGGPSVLLGDVNDDNKIDSTDARMVLQHEVHLITLDTAAEVRANVNGDATVDSTDARLILQYEVHLIDHF